MSAPDTIFALSSAPGRGGVAVIRVSGPAALTGLSALTQKSDDKSPPPRRALLRILKNPVDPLDILDQAVVVYFKGPESFTGEDCIEYHTHGGIAVIDGVLRALGKMAGYRIAQPGEFTRRAFENGKMDLTSAEAVADLIHAETEEQRRQAVRQMGGGLSRIYEGWKDRLARLLALMEADLDFSDQDLPDDVILRVRPDMSDLVAEISAHLDDNRRGEMLRDGVRVAILGAPNAGKSSLVNALTQREVAIVSAMAGTTRDVIDVTLNIGGYPVILSDTAGLRTEGLGEGDHDRIEREGIRRAISKAGEADIKILMFDGTTAPDPETLGLKGASTILVRNKADLVTAGTPAPLEGMLDLSVHTGAGLDALLDRIVELVRDRIGQRETPSLTRARHRESLEKARAALIRSMEAPLPELAAEDLRLAIRAIGSITGKVDVEDILDLIFRDFCIGK